MPPKATGLAQLKKGFCFDEQHDELFALGWPHLRRLTDDGDVDVGRAAGLQLLATDFDLTIDWPRSVAAALVHAWGVGALFDFAPSERHFRKAARDAMKDTRVPDRSQVDGYLRERLHRSPLWASERATRSFVLLLEALTQTEWVVAGILDELEAMDLDTLVAWATQPAWVTFQLGYLLLRLDEGQAKAARKRMEELVTIGDGWGHATGVPHDTPSHLRSLRLVLGGVEAAHRYTDRELRWYTHATDGGVTIGEQVRRHQGGSLPDVRLAWLGGADLLKERTFRRWPRLALRDRLWFQSCIAPIRHPRTAIYMADMLGHSTVQDRAKDWLREHRDFAKEVLMPMKADHAKAKRAMDLVFPYG